MDRRFAYRKKNVHDIQVEGLTVRLWSDKGPNDRREIQKLLEPLARSGFVIPYIALMPDWHPGADAIVGSVIPTKDVILPNVIGGDIGCGITAVRLPVTISMLSENLKTIATMLSEVIPSGSTQNATVSDRVKNNNIWERELKSPVSNRTFRKLIRQFASLGGGNHFLELQKDNENLLWIMIHSGSRYLGVEIRDYYLDEGAKRIGIDNKRYSKVPHLNTSD